MIEVTIEAKEIYQSSTKINFWQFTADILTL